MHTHVGRILATGRGAAWLARLTGGQEVAGSNPAGPTSGGNARDRCRTALAQRITSSVSKEPGVSPEYPDIPPQYPSYYPRGGGRPPQSQHDIERIAEEHSREDEALHGKKRRSLWRRLFGR